MKPACGQRTNVVERVIDIYWSECIMSDFSECIPSHYGHCCSACWSLSWYLFSPSFMLSLCYTKRLGMEVAGWPIYGNQDLVSMYQKYCTAEELRFKASYEHVTVRLIHCWVPWPGLTGRSSQQQRKRLDGVEFKQLHIAIDCQRSLVILHILPARFVHLSGWRLPGGHA